MCSWYSKIFTEFNEGSYLTIDFLTNKVNELLEYWKVVNSAAKSETMLLVL